MTMFAEPKLVLFFAASAALILTPGPAVLYIIARSASQGRRAGLVSVAGVGLGNLTHAITAALGLSAVLASSALVYATLKYAGAAYLVFLGLRKFASASADPPDAPQRDEPLRATFRQAALVGVLNPKTALFFVAFLPQFTDPGRGPAWAQLLALGAAFVVMAVVSDAAYAVLAGTVGSWLQRRAGVSRFARILSGLVYCALGIVAALTAAPRA
jgi:threonine/homoserine/homoserine lactone efflux protein